MSRDGAKYVLIYRQVGKKKKKKGILGGDRAVLSAAITGSIDWPSATQTIGFVVI